MDQPQGDLFPPASAVRVYTDGVHLSIDYADWIAPPAMPGGVPVAAWKRFEAVHEVARRIGLKRHWFENKRGSYPHYDLTTPSAARRAIEAGALLLSNWKDYARLAAPPGSRLRSLDWQPAHLPLDAALEAVEARNRNLMSLFRAARRSPPQ